MDKYLNEQEKEFVDALGEQSLIANEQEKEVLILLNPEFHRVITNKYLMLSVKNGGVVRLFLGAMLLPTVAVEKYEFLICEKDAKAKEKALQTYIEKEAAMRFSDYINAIPEFKQMFRERTMLKISMKAWAL